jgi:hypothetical protein
MLSKHPVLFWTIFAVFSALFLFGWFAYWEVKHQGIGSLVDKLPVTKDLRVGASAVGFFADAVMRTDGADRTYLVLFQNNLELRPGGGFLGSFGILTLRDGKVVGFGVHDTGNFDGRIPDTVEPPYPMRETLDIPSWKLRDSNWEPDFSTNAKQAVAFYEMGQGAEKFDGVIGITTDVLSSFLSVTGPVEIPGFPGTYDEKNAVIDLEYQVEQGFLEQDVDFGERKSVMSLLGERILERVRELPPQDLFRLFQVVLEDLNRKDIQLWFADEDLQTQAVAAGWAGSFDGKWSDDYLMAVDANLNSWKTDYVMKRSMHYVVDLSQETPKAKVTIHYEHTGKERNFMTKDYQTFLRVYVPDGSWLGSVSGNAKDPVFGTFMGKKFFGVLVHVPLGTSKDVSFEYDLPKDLERDFYDLKIQKQPGLPGVPVNISIVGKDGAKTQTSSTLDRDYVYSRESGS